MRTTWASIIAKPFWIFTGWVLRAPARLESARVQKAREEAREEGYREGAKASDQALSRAYREGWRDGHRKAALQDVKGHMLSKQRVGFTMSQDMFKDLQQQQSHGPGSGLAALLGSAGGALGSATGIFGGGGGATSPPRSSHGQGDPISDLIDRLMGD